MLLRIGKRELETVLLLLHLMTATLRTAEMMTCLVMVIILAAAAAAAVAMLVVNEALLEEMIGVV